MKIKFSLVIILTCLGMMLVGCSGADKKANKAALSEGSKTYTVTQETSSTRLYFNSTIKPISARVIVSPVNGILLEKKFNFGEMVHVAQDLMDIESEELEKEYTDAMTNFLKEKDEFINDQNKFIGEEELFNLGIVDKQSFDSTRSQLNNKRITLLQSADSLNKILAQHGIDLDEVEELDISDIEAIEEIINRDFSLITIQAPATGVVLLPPSNSSGMGNEEMLEIGSVIKKDEPILSIGDLSGVTADINIPEVHIHRLTPGTPATITGVAFPDIVLKGKISTINSQASTAGYSSSLPTFPGIVIVPKLTAEEQQAIRVGMSAKVQIDIQTLEAIEIPIAAVYQKNGSVFVKRKTPGGTEEVAIETGDTLLDTVVVTSGLSPGDIIVYEQAQDTD